MDALGMCGLVHMQPKMDILTSLNSLARMDALIDNGFQKVYNGCTWISKIMWFYKFNDDFLNYIATKTKIVVVNVIL